jgi:hypothetical protein
MRKRTKGIRITVLLLLLLLSEEGASYLIERGESDMGKQIYAAGELTTKPPIDMNVPTRTETATFALG